MTKMAQFPTAQATMSIGLLPEVASPVPILVVSPPPSHTFTVGQLVCLRSNSNAMFPVLEILPSFGSQTRFHVFENGMRQVYYESQLQAFDEQEDTESSKQFRESFLALCPNYAAAYQYANAQKNSLLEFIATASGNEISVTLGGNETTIYFTQVHLADINACFESQSDNELTACGNTG